MQLNIYGLSSPLWIFMARAAKTGNVKQFA